MVCLEALVLPKEEPGKKKPKDDAQVLEDLDFRKCVGDFPFIAIKNMSGLNEGIQGILGMGPSKESAPSFIESLQAHERIVNGLTSFSLGNNRPSLNQESYMIFGGINYT